MSDNEDRGLFGLSWTDVVVIIAGCATLVALSFAPAASCSFKSSDPASTTESVDEG